MTKRKRSHPTVTREQAAWYDMIYRCHRPNHARYKDYGAKGVTVCDLWRGPNGRELFVQHVGPRPDGHELARLDRSKPYEPGNVAWLTRSEQRRLSVDVPKLDGKPLIEAAECVGLDTRLVRRRVQSGGWSAEEALRYASGERNGKLTPDKVRHIRELDQQGIKRCKIAEMMHVSGAMISDICNGKKWKNVA